MSESASWQALAYRVGDFVFLTTIGGIAEVLEPSSLTPIPNTQPWFLGLASCRGNVIAVSDLHAYLGGGLTLQTPISRYLVIKVEGDSFALLVDEVLGLQKYRPSQLSEEAVDLPYSLKPYIHGAASSESGCLSILDPLLVVNSEHFLSIKLPPLNR
jgi:twitching motility protein PilI